MNQPSSCLCLEAPGAGLLLLSNLGFDRNYGEAFLLRCPRCSHHWLRYEYALEAISYSGRWYLGLISPAQIATLTADNAREAFSHLDWYFFGGSYFDGRVGKRSGPVLL